MDLHSILNYLETADWVPVAVIFGGAAFASAGLAGDKSMDDSDIGAGVFWVYTFLLFGLRCFVCWCNGGDGDTHLLPMLAGIAVLWGIARLGRPARLQINEARAKIGRTA